MPLLIKDYVNRFINGIETRYQIPQRITNRYIFIVSFSDYRKLNIIEKREIEDNISAYFLQKDFIVESNYISIVDIIPLTKLDPDEFIIHEMEEQREKPLEDSIPALYIDRLKYTLFCTKNRDFFDAKDLELEKKRFIIGRKADSFMQIVDPSVSQEHATIHYINNKFFLSSSSRNGTIISYQKEIFTDKDDGGKLYPISPGTKFKILDSDDIAYEFEIVAKSRFI